MNFYDPYHLKDPTQPPAVVLKQDLRGLPRHLRFGGNVLTPVNNPPFEETIPVDARYWQNSAIAARNRLDAISEEFRREVLPDETEFSWRMIYELYAEAEYTHVSQGKSQDEAVRAAHEYLEKKQRTTAAILNAELDAVMDGTHPSPIISGGEIVEVSPYVPPSELSDDENIPF